MLHFNVKIQNFNNPKMVKRINERFPDLSLSYYSETISVPMSNLCVVFEQLLFMAEQKSLFR